FTALARADPDELAVDLEAEVGLGVAADDAEEGGARFARRGIGRLHGGGADVERRGGGDLFLAAGGEKRNPERDREENVGVHDGRGKRGCIRKVQPFTARSISRNHASFSSAVASTSIQPSARWKVSSSDRNR